MASRRNTSGLDEGSREARIGIAATVTLRLAAIATAISIGVVLGVGGGMLLLGVMACSSVLVEMMGLRRLLFHQDNGVLA